MEEITQRKIFEVTKNYKNVIWDWNGTLIDDVDIVAEANSRVLRQYGLPEISREEYRNKFLYPLTEYYELLGFDLSLVDFREIGDRFIKIYDQLVQDVSLFEGTHELLEKHRAQGVCQSILSAAKELCIIALLERFQISDYFSHVFGLDNHYNINKLKRGQELMTESGWLSSETILIGDTEHDKEVADLLGVDLLLVADGHQSYLRLLEMHDQVIESRYE